jgi:flavorubredoxin
MKPIEIAPDIYDVGVNDWNIEDFHGYSTPMGTSYNAFLIKDEKIVLVDVVKDKEHFPEEMLAKIAKVVDPSKIDYIISNHTEMDHSGSMVKILQAVGPETPIICSKMGQKNLAAHFHKDWNFKVVGSGEEFSLGRRTLMFLETRMLHWPDSMFTYIKEDKILFSSDAFGQHYAGNELYADEMGGAVMPHAKKYYANILMHFSPQVLKLVDTVKKLGLEFNLICPDHGVYWRKDIHQIIDAYVDWANQERVRKAVLVYDSMWQSTEKMANAIASGIADKGVEVRPMTLRKWHRSDVMTEVMDAGAIIVGSPTLNNNMFPTVADMLVYMKGLRPRNKLAAAFGSYGWSGEAVKLINAEFEAMKLEIADPGLRIKFVPDNDGLEQCFEWGQKIGTAISA